MMSLRSTLQVAPSGSRHGHFSRDSCHELWEKIVVFLIYVPNIFVKSGWSKRINGSLHTIALKKLQNQSDQVSNRTIGPATWANPLNLHCAKSKIHEKVTSSFVEQFVEYQKAAGFNYC